jgi:hypothetical protein
MLPERSAADVIATFAEQATEIDGFFAATLKAVHGVDITELPDGPPPETMGDWVDPAVTQRNRGMAFCAPVIRGQEARGAAWTKGTQGYPSEPTRHKMSCRQAARDGTDCGSPDGPAAKSAQMNTPEGTFGEGGNDHVATSSQLW